MAIFKNFKCPNGLPPDECGHVQQLLINLANAYIKRMKRAQIKENDLEKPIIKQNSVVSDAERDRQRVRTR